jgi:hypothetical protein
VDTSPAVVARVWYQVVDIVGLLRVLVEAVVEQAEAVVEWEVMEPLTRVAVVVVAVKFLADHHTTVDQVVLVLS